MEEDRKETPALVLEKRKIENTLKLAGGNDFRFLLQDCADLSDMIDEIEDVSGQMGEKEHAAFEAKIKFSRKVRRKAKDLKNFEQHLVSEYESRHITLEHGRKMVSIIKLLRSKSVDKAKREAKEFYHFLEMGSRLEAIDEMLSRKKAQLEREGRGIEAQLAGIEWLEKEPPVDEEMAGRHEEMAQIERQLSKIWAAHVQMLKSMPVCSLLGKMNEDGLGKIGFPCLPGNEADSLAAFLQKSKLEAKTAEELHEMAGQSEQLLRHLGLDLPLFRQEVAARKAFLFGIMSFSADSRALAAGSPALAFLSENDAAAHTLAGKLSELGKTSGQDSAEWERASKIRQKKEELAGASKAELEKSLQGIRELEDVLGGKAEPPGIADGKRGWGIAEAILSFIGRKN